MSKDFEWLTGKAEKHGFTFTKKDYSIEEAEKMGFTLKEQLALTETQINRFRKNGDTEIILFAIAGGISSLFLPFTIVLGMIGYLLFIDILFVIIHKKHKAKILKEMYLRSVR